MSYSDDDVAKWTQEFMGAGFYRNVLEPRMREIEEECSDAVLKLVENDAPKNKFTVVSGKLQMIRQLQDEISHWARLDRYNEKE